MQITLFPNQGLCIAVKIHHAACDGVSSIHFLKSWAAATSAATPQPGPNLDRSSISDPHSLYSKLARTVLLQRSQFYPSKTSPPSPTILTTIATFTLPSRQIQRLKSNLPSSSPHISTFLISAAVSWTCLLKSTRPAQFDPARPAHLLFSVDWRTRMRPPPPANYFGNCLGCPCFVEAAAGDIVEEKDGFLKACEAIGKAIGGIGDDVYEGMRDVVEKVMAVVPKKPLSIAGSQRLRVYDVEFGWGRPAKVEVASIGGSGAISLAESRDDEGGVEIGVVLGEEEMVGFGKEFDKFIVEYD